MLYEAYEAKMRRIAEKLDKIRRHRVLILCCCAFILLLIAAFLFFKGTVILDAVAPSEPIVYGESVEFRGKALFGRTASQYRSTDSSEWQDGFPTMPGEYVVRLVSKRSFGLKQYGAEQTVTVLKRPLTVSVFPSAIYGEAPEPICDGIASGDSVGEVSVVYTDPYADSSDVEITGFTVLNADGEDVTGGYDISFVGGRVVFEKRPITVRTDSAEKVYDGLPLRAEGVTLADGSLAYTDALECSAYPFITNAAVGAENRPSGLRILNEHGEDVSRLYALTEEYGTLTVLKRPLTVQSSSHEKVYDGAPFKELSASVTEGTLAEGHGIAFEFGNAGLLHAGDKKNTVNALITDAQGKDVSGNYEVKILQGDLKISPRPVTVTGSSRTWIFDGLVHSAKTLFPRFTVSKAAGASGLLDGHSVEADTVASIHTVGSVENLPEKIKIKDSYGADVTSCYDIITVGGTLTVLKRAITVTVKDVEFVYTGMERRYPETDSSEQYYELTLREQVALPDGMAHDTALVETDAPLGANTTKPTVLTCRYTGGITRVGSAEIGAFVHVTQGSDITSCFDITVEKGTLTVVPRKITLTPERVSGIYNGGILTLSEYRTAAVHTDTVPQDEMIMRIIPTVWINGEGTVAGDYGTNIVRYEIKTSSGEDITDCFDITCAEGVYTVSPRPIRIVLGSGEWIYDGLSHRLTGEDAYTAVSLVGNETSALCKGHTLEITALGEIVNVGTEIHTLGGAPVIRDAEGEDVTENYDIAHEDGTLTVIPRPLSIRIASGTKVYDGAPLTAYGYEIEAGSVVDGQSLSVAVNGSRIFAGESPNTAAVTVTADGIDVTYNYDITVYDGVLTVTPRPLHIGTASAEKIYDGEGLTADGFEILSGSAADGDVLDIAVVGIRTEAGESLNNALVTVTRNGEDVTDSYAVRLEPGKLTVHKRPVKIGMETFGFTYDGVTRYAKDICRSFTVKEEGYYGFAEGHAMSVSITFRSDRITSVHTLRLAGEYTVTVDSYVITDGDGADRTSNYELVFEEGHITVLPRRITVTAASGEFAYDGRMHYASELIPDHTATADGLPYEKAICEEDSAFITVGGEIMLPGTVPSTVDAVTVLDKNGEDISFCYSVTAEDGTLTVNRSVILIRSDDGKKQYDGTPLTQHSFTLVGFLYPDDRIIAEYTGSQTEVGESLNLFTYIIVNADGVDVTDSYIHYSEYGILTVTEEVVPKPPDPPKPDAPQGGGDIGGDVGNEKPDPDSGEGKAVFSYVASASGLIYFRQSHFGSYDAVSGWLNAPQGEDDYTFTMLSDALMTNRPTDTVRIKPYGSMLYLSTYYADKASVRFGRTDAEYTVGFYGYDYLNESSLPRYSAEMKQYEALWREYAYRNYTALPDKTREAMEQIIDMAAASTGAKLGSMSRKDTVRWVCEYIKGAAVYDLQFPDFPEGVDKAIYFLTVAKRGVCRHFATSAVVMYRALGIPARYTVGYVSDSVEGETVEVSALQAHAWVEVYIDGIGWVSVDPTGGGPEGDGGNGGTPPQTEKAGTVTIVPYSIKKVYSGKPVSCGEGQFWIKSGADTLPEGYSISVTVEGSQTKVGVGVSKITAVVIRDADGNDITERYDIVCEDGVIEVMPIKIVVYTASASKNYDGRKLTAEECSVIMGKLLDGHSIKGYGYSYIVGIGSEPNTVEEIVVYDANGQDVTDCYEIEIRLGTLTITGGGG